MLRVLRVTSLTYTGAVKRRRALELFGASASAVYLAACASVPQVSGPAATPPAPSSTPPPGTPAPATVSTTTPPQQQAAQPKRGGTLRAAIVGDLTSIDGQQSLPGVTGTVGNAYETLTRYDAQLQPQGLLAESWDVSGDGEQIKVNLRKGVQFQDGRELTSDDVNYSLMR